jgi:phenylpyruvate tautomerase PptA (4-oxalocrotonate tautomerase family)
MPFVRIDMNAGQYDVQQRAVISDVLFEAVQTIGAKEGERFQAFNEHPPGKLMFAPEFLGISHTDGFIAIQIMLVEGRSSDQKKE